VYDRVFQKFEEDNSRPPDEAEIVTLTAQAAQYAEEIKGTVLCESYHIISYYIILHSLQK
jgi:hypothetical protein